MFPCLLLLKCLMLSYGEGYIKKNPNRLSGLKIGGSGSEDTQAAKFMRVKNAEDTTIVLESSGGCGREREIIHYSAYIRVLICPCI